MKPPAQPTLDYGLLSSCAPRRTERPTPGHGCSLRPRACRSLALLGHRAGPAGTRRERRSSLGHRHQLSVIGGRRQGRAPLGTVLGSQHRSPQGLPAVRASAGPAPPAEPPAASRGSREPRIRPRREVPRPPPPALSRPPLPPRPPSRRARAGGGSRALSRRAAHLAGLRLAP